MNDDPPGRTDWNASSAQTKLTRRRVERIVWIVFAAIFVLPMALFALASSASSVGVAFGLLLALPLTLFSFLFPILIPLVVLTGIGYAIYAHYHPAPRKQNVQPPHDDGRGHATQVSRSAMSGTSVGESIRESSVPTSAVAALESLRSQTQEASRRRMRMFIPAGIGSALLLFWLMTSSGSRWHSSPGVILITMMALGAAGGWLMAVARPGKRYAQSFKQTLIPSLSTRFGGLTHRLGETVDIARLAETGILPHYTRVEVDDTISGTFRGYPITITELTLKRRSGRRRPTVFHGLIMEIAASPAFDLTAVIRDSEVDKTIPVRAGRPLQRVEFDDAAFTEIYAVYGSDDGAIRSTITPAFRNSLMTMADGKGFHPPLLLCEGGSMTAAMQTSDWRNLLEPPSLLAHDAATQAAMVEAELADIFALADALIALHSPAAGHPIRPE